MVRRQQEFQYRHPNDSGKMEDRIAIIEATIKGFEGALITSTFVQQEEVIRGSILFTEQTMTLPFNVEIYPQYPFQFQDSETIRFINKDLLAFDHINEDGSVCVHTLHHPKLSEKINLDLNSLRHWMIKYYINEETERKYEHLVVNHKALNGENSVFLFTEVDYMFKKGMHGKFKYSILREGSWRKETYVTLLVQSFIINRDQPYCKWSSAYKQFDLNEGIFYFNDAPPVENRRFAVKY